tara:strand:- start:94 stop:480 length:387 start_codon:yes stop_codon:yes gene_type:complete
MLDIIKTEKANKTLNSIYNDYISYCVENDFTMGWDIQRFKVSLKHTFENDFECFHKLVKEDAIKWAKCGAFSSNEEAWKFSWNQVFRFTQQITGFLFYEGYLKEVEAETDSDDEVAGSLPTYTGPFSA